jgi:hypothetical protein
MTGIKKYQTKREPRDYLERALQDFDNWKPWEEYTAETDARFSKELGYENSSAFIEVKMPRGDPDIVAAFSKYR